VSIPHAARPARRDCHPAVFRHLFREKVPGAVFVGNAFEIGKRHVQRLVPERDSDGVYLYSNLRLRADCRPTGNHSIRGHKRVSQYRSGETSYNPTSGPE
jgi:hypothetical protein